MAEEEQDQTHTIIAKEEQDQSGISHLEEGNPINTEEANDKKEKSKKIKRKKRLLEEANDVAKRGVCYLSRVPPRMDPLKVRQLLSEYGDIERVYLKPEGPSFQENRRKKGGFRGQIFTEGWVEFTKRSVAKRVANLLNGEKIGGKRRSMFFYDIWNIKYLSKFKWNDLTGEIAYKSVVREQKLALEISAAKRERDFYLSKVDKSRALISIQERINKVCTEGQDQAADHRFSNETMYKYDDKEKKWDVPGHLISCVDTFNVLLRPHFYSTEFGGQNVKLNLKRFGSNILATSEMKDPFSYNGLLENVTDSILAVTTKNGIHMADMRGLGGPSYIIEQQRKILEIITGLVDQYRADAKELHR